MDQVMIYCILNQNNFTQEEMEIIQQGIFKYITWNTIDIWDIINTQLPTTIKKSMPAPFYNPAKGIPWLVKEWTNIEQYLQIGEIKEQTMDETAMTLTEEQIQEIQELADLYKEEENVIITHYKTASSKGKKKISKEVQFEDLPKEERLKKGNNPEKGKGKEAEKDQSTTGGDDPGDDFISSSESSNGRESDSEDESEDNTRKVRQLLPSQKE